MCLAPQKVGYTLHIEAGEVLLKCKESFFISRLGKQKWPKALSQGRAQPSRAVGPCPPPALAWIIL